MGSFGKSRDFLSRHQWAYEQLASKRTAVPSDESMVPNGGTPVEIFLGEISSKPWKMILNRSLFPLYPILGFIKEKLFSLGAQAALAFRQWSDGFWDFFN